MDEEIALFFGGALALSVVSVVGWVRASHRARRLENRLFSLLEPREAGSELEETVERLAAQVERLSKGQEFLSGLLAGRHERPGRPAMAAVKGITPS
jgi:hypothetical protein